ncbi:MAG: hypothetical protein QNJ29_09925 [Rhizobiaceae bacterium]|nr:hypothetical protein [Rhizobiaceae bacterium]
MENAYTAEQSVQYRKSRHLQERYQVTDMTIWRWVQNGLLAKPLYINRQRYWTEDQLSEFEARMATEAA